MGRIPDEAFNAEVARQFRSAADLLESQSAEPFRIRSYRRAADTLDELAEPVSQTYRTDGLQGLIALPTIGRNLAMAIADVTDFGRWRWLDRLTGDGKPARLFETVAGIGPGLAERVHQQLGVETLEELASAAADGRLALVPGFGPKRIHSVRESLAGRFSTQRQVLVPHVAPIEDLLDIDREYRLRALANDLPTIVPLRHNPTREEWLPVLHTERNSHGYTAMFSNSIRAHELGRVRDWVLIYADAPDHGEWTIVDEQIDGASRRVVRDYDG